MNINEIMQIVTYAMALIGGLAFIVSIIVQVIKDLPGLKKIPTSVVALAASLVLLPSNTDRVMYILQGGDYLVLCICFFYRCIYCISGSNRRMGKSKRHLGQNKIQGFRGRVIVLFF